MTLRYKLRTLLIVLALGPPLLAAALWLWPTRVSLPDWIREFQRKWDNNEWPARPPRGGII